MARLEPIMLKNLPIIPSRTDVYYLWWEGGGVGREVKTRGDQLPTDGPNYTTRPKGHHSYQG